MEQEQQRNAFENSLVKKRRKKRTRTIVTIAVLLVIAAAAAILLPPLLHSAEADATSTVTYRVDRVFEGEISTTLSGSGALTPSASATFTAPADAVVEEVLKQPGDAVAAGETVLRLSSESVEEEIESLETQLESTRKQLASTRQDLADRNITATKAGYVKNVQAKVGDNSEDLEYLCLISTDGRMKLVFSTDAAVRKYDAVTFQIGSASIEGQIMELDGNTVTAVIEKNTYPIGTEASVYAEDGTLLGTGGLELNEYIQVTNDYGRITKVYATATEGRYVYAKTVLFKLDAGAPNPTYLSRKETEADYLEQIADLEASLLVTADWDGVVTAIDVAVGDELLAGDTLCSLMAKDGYTLAMTVDELDISSVSLGQQAAVTLDAIDGDFTGKVADIVYEGNSSGNVTTFDVTLAIDYIEGAYPGVSASAEIITQSSGTVLVVPVDAVQYENGNAFLYLASSDAVIGTSVGEAEMDLSALEKVSVTTGMSDGSYVAVSGDLAANDLIWVPKRTTTSTYSGSTTSSTNSSFSFGGDMGGMSMGGNMQPPNMGSTGSDRRGSGSGSGSSNRPGN